MFFKTHSLVCIKFGKFFSIYGQTIYENSVFARISDGMQILKKFVLQTFFSKFQQSKNFCMMLKLVGTKKLSDLLNA